MINDVFPTIPEGETEFYIRKPYTRTRSPLSFAGVTSVTDQSFGNDTDVNKIIARCKRTGEELPETAGPGEYGDCTQLQKDLTLLIDEARNTLREYEQQQAERAAEVARKAASDADKAKQFDELMKKQAEIMKPSDDGTQPS